MLLILSIAFLCWGRMFQQYFHGGVVYISSLIHCKYRTSNCLHSWLILIIRGFWSPSIPPQEIEHELSTSVMTLVALWYTEGIQRSLKINIIWCKNVFWRSYPGRSWEGSVLEKHYRTAFLQKQPFSKHSRKYLSKTVPWNLLNSHKTHFL